MVGASGVNSMFIGYDLPKFGTYLVAALACLNVNNLSHVSDMK
jgi:hypothetical protein